jgi:hypothetical protein
METERKRKSASRRGRSGSGRGAFYVSRVRNAPVVDGNGARVGRLRDVVAAIETEGNPVAFAAFHLKPSAFEASSIDTGQTDLTRRMTTIWPGRPGPGRWAVAASDQIVIFEGTKVLQKLGPSPLLPLTYRGLR